MYQSVCKGDIRLGSGCGVCERCRKQIFEMNAKKFEENCVKSLRAKDWENFSEKVKAHIENYTVPQYGDKGNDLASEYTTESCLNQVKKYAARFGKNSRPGQEKLDLLKMAHYIQMAFEALEQSDNG